VIHHVPDFGVVGGGVKSGGTDLSLLTPQDARCYSPAIPLRLDPAVPEQERPRRALLEVIALTPEDAVAAQRGGADRLEIVRNIAVGGLTPEIGAFRAIRNAVDLPLRVMLRTNGGFSVAPDELEELVESADALKSAGADQFVFGFLRGDGGLDLDATNVLAAAAASCPWTLHHAFDHAVDARSAWDAASRVANIDAVLSGGARGDLTRGLGTLCDRAGWQSGAVRWLAGGGLALEHVEPLWRAGVTMFHIGRRARYENSWEQPLNANAVRIWREKLDVLAANP
jgi:copper homeostasis protein